MTTPYPWVNPEEIVDISPEKAIRKAFSSAFSPPGWPRLNPDKPLPALLGFSLMFTRPHPTIAENALWSPVVLLRWPAHIELVSAQFLRPDSILDVHHATVRGRTHALFALSDAQFNDDVAAAGNTRFTVPPNEIGVTVQTRGDLRTIRPLVEGQPSTKFPLRTFPSPQT